MEILKQNDDVLAQPVMKIMEPSWFQTKTGATAYSTHDAMTASLSYTSLTKIRQINFL
jgi:hypothetical protein